MSFSLCQINYLVYGYGIWDSNHGVVRFLCNQCSASAYVMTGFIKPSKWYREPRACRIGKRRRKEEIFILENQNI